MDDAAVEDAWRKLKRFTDARVALGRAGDSLPTHALLEFALAHAQARDAVHHSINFGQLSTELAAVGFLETVRVRSRARDRDQYLRRPDLGRQLAEDNQTHLEGLHPDDLPDLIFVIADGLSARAAEGQAARVMRQVCDQLTDWRIGPVVMAEQARVAIGDEIGELLRARAVAVLIGERPGLSSADSLGAYLTYHPRVGRTDAERNCISNIRPGGLSPDLAACRLVGLLRGARALGLSGVALKDESEQPSQRVNPLPSGRSLDD